MNGNLKTKLAKLKQEYGPTAMPHIDWTNLTACCNQCNGRKHAKPLLTALMERNGYRERIIGWAEKV